MMVEMEEMGRGRGQKEKICPFNGGPCGSFCKLWIDGDCAIAIIAKKLSLVPRGVI